MSLKTYQNKNQHPSILFIFREDSWHPGGSLHPGRCCSRPWEKPKVLTTSCKCPLSYLVTCYLCNMTMLYLISSYIHNSCHILYVISFLQQCQCVRLYDKFPAMSLSIYLHDKFLNLCGFLFLAQYQ